ncbi:DUF2721 domain-containing protein [Spirochaeta cellobiosiphila]|uniref:DUF2721 domain-containing protein n=1 Tax=Spirochaeta cellobiosiphila TaxID=504483 RepID=UPI0009FBE4E7|nr:DUF2721 domain-containing protein [Spirochaeta cellobiosiphila]
MNLTITTPALLFPAISLLLLAYTNRYLTLASLVRDLHDRYKKFSEDHLTGQIKNLRVRIKIIKNMQILGVASFFLCVATMLVLFVEWELAGTILFAISLILLLASLALSIAELRISADALDIQLQDCE